jgi:LemA protein
MNAMGEMKEMSKVEGALSGALKSVFALAENYPDLKANANFLELQRELRDTEDKIQSARRFYNGNVLSFNTKIEQFPSNMVASMFHFERKDFFELDATERAAADQPVKVEF